MKVDQVVQAQQAHAANAQATARAIAHSSGYTGPQAAAVSGALYPSLMEYMGMEITQEMVNQNNQLVAQNNQVAQRFTSTGQGQVAPVTGQDVGLRKAEIRQGIREVILCKDQEGKIGLRVQSVNKGLFVSFVHNNSPAALAGLRFGDQVLQINGENVAGWDSDKALKVLKKALPDKITMAIRDRPFERTITLQKDSAGTVGFVFKDNKITAIVKDSSAARNGVLTEHHMVEVNGQNVVGLKEKDIKVIFDKIPRTVTITIVPSFVYDHIMKSIGSSLVKKHMDHSVPDL